VHAVLVEERQRVGVLAEISCARVRASRGIFFLRFACALPSISSQRKTDAERPLRKRSDLARMSG